MSAILVELTDALVTKIAAITWSGGAFTTQATYADVDELLDAATGPLKLLAHMEKSADDTPGDVRVSHMAIRTMDLAS